MLELIYHDENRPAGMLHMEQLSKFSRRFLKPTMVSIMSADTPQRLRVEQFIANIYRESYQAEIKVNYPMLISVSDSNGNLLAAAGFRPAHQASLFLEQYLDHPVESVLETSRGRIVEIGNLASDGSGAPIYLYAALAAHLFHQGFKYAVVTSTRGLERQLRQGGLVTRRHVKADPQRLKQLDDSWGNYYETQPHVLSCSVADSYRRLQRTLGENYYNYDHNYYTRLHYKNQEQD